MGEIFLNHNHLGDWLAQAEQIRTARGTSHALHYLIGEKFFNLASLCRFFRNEIPAEAPGLHFLSGGCRPSADSRHGWSQDPHDSHTVAVHELEDMLAEFAMLINQSFEAYLIRGYLAEALRGEPVGMDSGRHRPGHDDALPDQVAIWKDMLQYLSVV